MPQCKPFRLGLWALFHNGLSIDFDTRRHVFLVGKCITVPGYEGHFIYSILTRITQLAIQRYMYKRYKRAHGPLVA